MPKLTASQKRENALSSLCNLAFAADGSYQWGNVPRTNIAEALRDIKKMGKTERWEKVMDKWIEMVMDDEVDIVWCLLQYSVYAGAASQSKN